MTKKLLLPLLAWHDQVLRSLDPCSNGPGFETTFRTAQGVRREVCQLSLIPCKKTKRITMSGLIEKKEQGRTAQLVYRFSEAFVLYT